MGIMKDAVVGKVRGKLGNVVIYEVNGQVRVRMTPGSYKDKKSPAQLEHRAKVRGIAELYDKLDLQLVKYWKELTRGTTMNGYNLFMSRNIGNMTGEGKVADVAKVVLCQGDLTVPAWVRAEEKEEGVLEVTWEKRSEGRYEWGIICRWWCTGIGRRRRRRCIGWMISTGRRGRTEGRSGGFRRG